MASATKLITTVAALQLVEKGLWTLETDVRGVLPELEAIKRLDGFDANDEPILLENDVPITLKQLLTHTAGFCYEWSAPNGQQAKYREKMGIKGQLDPESDRSSIMGIQLDFIPGSRKTYGPSVDWVGFAIEKLSALTLEEYFQQNIFEPLGIHDTSFFVKEDLVNMAYRQEPLPAKTTFIPGASILLSTSYQLGGGGLYGSATSYLKFLRALLPNFPGPKILGEELIAQMFLPQLANDQQRADIARDCATDMHPWNRVGYPDPEPQGLDFGLGGALSLASLRSGRKKGSLLWCGTAGTYWVIDRTSDLAFVVWTNLLPFADPATFELWEKVEPLFYKGLSQSASA